jgi:hypothetical protein
MPLAVVDTAFDQMFKVKQSSLRCVPAAAVK